MLIYSCYYLKSTYFRVAKYDCDTLVAVYGPCIGKGNKNKRKTSSNIFNSSVFCIGLFLLSRLQMVCFILPHTTDIKNFFFSYFLSKKKTVVFISYRLALGCVSIRSKRKKKKKSKFVYQNGILSFWTKRMLKIVRFFSTHPRM